MGVHPMMDITILRASGLTDEQILKVLETEQNEKSVYVREQNRIRQRNHRSRNDVTRDKRDKRDTGLKTDLSEQNQQPCHDVTRDKRDPPRHIKNSPPNKKEASLLSIPRSKKGGLPTGFCLTAEDSNHALTWGWSESKIKTEFQRFCDHAESTGRKCVNWHAAWRNWVRSPYSNNGAKNGNPSSRSQLIETADRVVERAYENLAKVSGEGSFFDRESPLPHGPVPPWRSQ